jgi:hypothetical protein
VESDELIEAVGRACERRREAPPATLDVGYVRFKYGTSCLLGLSSGGAVPCDFGYLKVFEEGSDARVCVEKYAPRAGDHGWAEEVPLLRGALFRFPLDRTVSSLSSISDMGRLKHVLHAAIPDWSPQTWRVRARKSGLRMLRYKPERRGIARADLRLRHTGTGESRQVVVVAQAYADGLPGRVRGVLDHLRAWTESFGATPPFRVPRALGADATRRVLLRTWSEGEDWGETLGTPRFREGCVAAAHALRRLRDMPRPVGLPASALLTEADTVLADLAAIDGRHIGGIARDLARDLPRRAREAKRLEAVLVHGDFHYHQLLLAGSGDPHTLIDWDECRIGDPREDVGNLLAHLHLAELDGRLDAGESRGLRRLFHEESGALPGVDVFTALQLVKLSFVPFRNLRADWRDAARRLLDRAGSLVGRAPVAR